MKLKLYDSLKGEVSGVAERDRGTLSVYSCGPTVYNHIHVGNARPFWIAMLLKRFAEQRLGTPVRLAINITDVNDRIYEAARAQGVPSTEIAERYGGAYIAATSELGLGRPDVEPLATETIPQIIALIERLMGAGLAYESAGDVYFRVGAFPTYGRLSGQRTEELVEGARVELGEIKESALDFALWKATKPDEDTSWPSPWGDGRPGWHIECSAMAREHLGVGFDVHGGGLDLVFPHHENERAQSEGAGDVPFARTWMHNGMLRLASEKMSKSVGNIETLRAALDRVGAETLLMFFARAKYRSPVDYDDDTLAQARAANETLREALRNARRYAATGAEGDETLRTSAARVAQDFDAAMADDLDTPAALAVLHGLARELNVAAASSSASSAAVGAGADALVAALDVLGLAGLDAQPQSEAPAEARELLEERTRAREARDFARADDIRDRLSALGWAIRDTAQGPELERLDDAPPA